MHSRLHLRRVGRLHERSLRALRVAAGAAWLQIVEVIADCVLIEDLRRHHLRVHRARVVAQLEVVNAFDAEAVIERMRPRLFFHDRALVGATGNETGEGEEKEKTHRQTGDEVSHGSRRFDPTPPANCSALCYCRSNA